MSVTLEDAKAYLNISSPNQDAELTPIVEGVNAYITSLSELPTESGVVEIYFSHEVGQETVQPLNLSKFMRNQTPPEVLVIRTFYESGAFGQEEVEEFNLTLTSLTIPRSAASGEYSIQILADKDPVVEGNKRLAKLELIKYYYKQEYKQTQSNGGQTVTTTPFTGSLPKHIRALLDTFRGL